MCEHLRDEAPYALASSSDRNPTSLLPNSLLPRDCEVTSPKHSRVVGMGGKPQERAGRRKELQELAGGEVLRYCCSKHKT